MLQDKKLPLRFHWFLRVPIVTTVVRVVFVLLVFVLLVFVLLVFAAGAVCVCLFFSLLILVSSVDVDDSLYRVNAPSTGSINLDCGT